MEGKNTFCEKTGDKIFCPCGLIRMYINAAVKKKKKKNSLVAGELSELSVKRLIDKF